MKIKKNTSPVASATVRRYVTAAHNEIARERGRLPAWQWDAMQVTARTRRDGAYSGRATIGGAWIHFSIPRGMTPRKLAILAFHELMHSYGIRSHANGICDPTENQIARMLASLYRGAAIPATIDAPPPAKAKGRTPAADRAAAKLESLAARLKAWTTKRKRAETAIRKLTRQIRAMERRAAAAGKE